MTPATSQTAGPDRERVVFAGVLLLALLVRLLLLDSRWINPDEGAHLMDGRLVLDGLVPGIDFSARQVIYVHLLAFFLKLSGSDLTSVRLFPVLFTVGAGAFLYLTARRLCGGAVALLAMALFLLLPFSILMTINLKTQPFMLFFSLGGLFFAVRGVQDRVTTFWPFFLSGVFLGLAYYIRESALSVMLAVGLLLLAVRPTGLGANLKRLSGFAAGMLVVVAVVVLYYLRHVSLAAALDLSQNPIDFVLENLRRVGDFLGRSGPAPTQEALVGPAHDQSYQVTLHFIREPAYFHLFLLAGAALSLPRFLAAFRSGDRDQQLVFWGVVPWLTLMTLAYAFWSVRRGFFIAYFLEFLPPLCILTASVAVGALQRLRVRPAPTADVLIVGLTLGALAVLQRVLGTSELDRPLFFVLTTLVLGIAYLRGTRPLHWFLLVVLASVATTGVVYAAARLPAALDLVLYSGFAGAVYYGVFRASGMAIRGSVPRIAGFVSYSLVVSAFSLCLFVSTPRLDLAYDCTWAPETLRHISAAIKREARAGDEVMSGGVIWEFQSGLRPFGRQSHPTGLLERMTVAEADAILARLKTNPPAFVVLDGFTQQTYLRHLPQIQALLDSRYVLRVVAAAGFEYPVRLFVLRGGPA